MSAGHSHSATTTDDARVVLNVKDPLELATALTSGDFPTTGIVHIDWQDTAKRLIVRGSLAAVSAATTYLHSAGVVS